MHTPPAQETSSAPIPVTGRTTDAHLPRGLAHAAIAAILYFAAAYAALLLQTGVAGVAIFWPASGIAAGLIIALGAPSYRPVAIGTVLATVAANLAFDRSLILSLIFGILNAGEAVAVAWVLAQMPKRRETFPRLMEVVSFFIAAAASTGTAAAIAAVMLQIVAGSNEGWGHLWHVWFLSDFIGVAVMAPLVITSVALIKSPAHHHDWSTDIALLLLLAVAAWHGLTIRLGSDLWLSLAPGTTVLPILIWIAARSQPIVPAVGVALFAVIMALIAASGRGRFGTPDVPLESRVLAAQASLATVSLVTLLISALFQERRTAETRIKTSERLLAVTADAAPGVIFSLRHDPAGRLHFPFVSAKSNAVLGLTPEALAVSADPLLSRLDPSCRDMFLRAIDQREGQQEPIRLELACPRAPDQTIWFEVSAAPTKDHDGAVVWHGFLQNVTARRVLFQEIDHRTRNLLAVVQSIAQHTAANSDPNDFADTFDERLTSLAASYSLISAGEWQGAEFEQLARSQLAHLASLIDTRITLSGPKLRLMPGAAQALGIAIHELGTNALKHGALSNDTGTVRLAWHVTPIATEQHLQIRWEECGGPPVISTGRHGFGRTVTQEMVAYQLKGLAVIEQHPAGIVWRVEAPVGHALYTASHAT